MPRALQLPAQGGVHKADAAQRSIACKHAEVEDEADDQDEHGVDVAAWHSVRARCSWQRTNRDWQLVRLTW